VVVELLERKVAGLALARPLRVQMRLPLLVALGRTKRWVSRSMLALLTGPCTSDQFAERPRPTPSTT
jgi:hypothetical protein